MVGSSFHFKDSIAPCSTSSQSCRGNDTGFLFNWPVKFLIILIYYQLSSVDDHHQEVIGFCRDNHFHGILAEEAEYAIFDPPRYFSSKQLKLTYKVTTKLIMVIFFFFFLIFFSFLGFVGDERVHTG